MLAIIQGELMRTLCLAALLAACSSGSSTPSVDAMLETISMTCSTGVTDYCKTNACDQTIALAEHDATLCPASEVTCGDYKVILRVDNGTSSAMYFQGGNLVAIAHPSAPGGAACLAGPTSFSALRCLTAGVALPACGSSDPPPSGW
jgi:hypothetical protein